MNIIVCIKQTPDTEKVKFNPETRTLLREGVENIMNPFDMQALETALIMKDKFGGKVTCISMGLPQATDVLKEALAMGASTMPRPARRIGTMASFLPASIRHFAVATGVSTSTSTVGRFRVAS